MTDSLRQQPSNPDAVDGKLDILAIGVHPDDVELGCSGTLINEIKRGKRAGIVDLTQGELSTRGTVETRYKEAAEAASIIGVAVRENLKLLQPDEVGPGEHFGIPPLILQKHKAPVTAAWWD